MPGCPPCWDTEQPGTGTLSRLPLPPVPLASRDDLGLGQAPQCWDSPMLSPTASGACALRQHPVPSPTASSARALPLCRATSGTSSGSPWVCAGRVCPQESRRLGSGRAAAAFWQQDRSPQGSVCPGDVGEPMEGCGAWEEEPAPDTAANPSALREERSYHGGLLHRLGLPALRSPHVTSERTPGLRESRVCQEPEALRGCEKTPVPPIASWPAWPLLPIIVLSFPLAWQSPGAGVAESGLLHPHHPPGVSGEAEAQECPVRHHVASQQPAPGTREPGHCGAAWAAGESCPGLQLRQPSQWEAQPKAGRQTLHPGGRGAETLLLLQLLSSAGALLPMARWQLSPSVAVEPQGRLSLHSTGSIQGVRHSCFLLTQAWSCVPRPLRHNVPAWRLHGSSQPSAMVEAEGGLCVKHLACSSLQVVWGGRAPCPPGSARGVGQPPAHSPRGTRQGIPLGICISL